MSRFKTAEARYDLIVEKVCDTYGVTCGEYISAFKYRPLPEVRQLVCFALSRFGLKNGEICELTGYTPGRVNYNLEAANKVAEAIPYFLYKANAIIKLLNDER